MSEIHLNHLRALASNFGVTQICSAVLDNEKFHIWTGAASPNTHHYGKGGLIVHTREVVDLCAIINNYFVVVDPKKLFLAALFHDIGKVWDYSPLDDKYEQWECAPHKRSIHHICRSALVWHDAAKEYKVETSFEDEVLHAILAHHGLREWGSPISPKSKMAWILHLCDGLSARIEDCDRRD